MEIDTLNLKVISRETISQVVAVGPERSGVAEVDNDADEAQAGRDARQDPQRIGRAIGRLHAEAADADAAAASHRIGTESNSVDTGRRPLRQSSFLRADLGCFRAQVHAGAMRVCVLRGYRSNVCQQMAVSTFCRLQIPTLEWQSKSSRITSSCVVHAITDHATNAITQ
jgi:hypothetical protein